VSITSRTHTHLSHSQTSRLLTSSLSLGVLGHTIDKHLLLTINKILIDKFSISSFCY
jgi:hypothetical protein